VQSKVEVSIRRSVIDDVIAHARAAAPAECCGMLLGEGAAIVDSLRAANIAEDPTRRFVVDPGDHIASRRKARERGLAIVGFYHSHPRSPAAPSATDVAEAGYDDLFHLIVSLAADPAVAQLFRLEGGNIRSVPLVTLG
jgi:desampylase